MSQKPSRLRIEHLKTIEPLTENQKKAFTGFRKGSHLVLSGAAGTGKTFIGLYLALEAVLQNIKEYQRVVIVRSAVPTRDIGYLPGTLEEKEEAYKLPYKSIINDLFDDGSAWSKLHSTKNIEFMTTSFVRGLTINNAIVIIDEAQNCNYHELCSIITRLGDSCKFIVCGDYLQSDFTRQNEKDGIKLFTTILEHMRHFDVIEFEWKDIVRSNLVRDFLMTKDLVERGKL